MAFFKKSYLEVNLPASASAEVIQNLQKSPDSVRYYRKRRNFET